MLGLRWRVAFGFALVGAGVTSGFAMWSDLEIRGDVIAEREDTAMRQSYAHARIIRARLDVTQPDPGDAMLIAEPSGVRQLARPRSRRAAATSRADLLDQLAWTTPATTRCGTLPPGLFDGRRQGARHPQGEVA